MGIWDNMKKIAQPYDNDYDDDYDDNDYGTETRGTAGSEAPAMDFSESIASSAPASGSFSGKVMSINRSHSEIRLVSPESFKDASVAAKHLCENRIVHLNVEHTDEVIARRVVDFLSGCVYALEGKVTKAGTYAYIFTPNNVEVNTEAAAPVEGAETEA